MASWNFVYLVSFVFICMLYGYLLSAMIVAGLLGIGVSMVAAQVIAIIVTMLSAEVLSKELQSAAFLTTQGIFAITDAATKGVVNSVSFVKDKFEAFRINRFNKKNGFGFVGKGAQNA